MLESHHAKIIIISFIAWKSLLVKVYGLIIKYRNYLAMHSYNTIPGRDFPVLYNFSTILSV